MASGKERGLYYLAQSLLSLQSWAPFPTINRFVYLSDIPQIEFPGIHGDGA